MPRLPSLDKFRGDHTQSFKQWILMFEAQLSALGTEDAKKTETLCLLDGQAFTFVTTHIAAHADATYAGLKTLLTTNFCGVDYKRAHGLLKHGPICYRWKSGKVCCSSPIDLKLHTPLP